MERIPICLVGHFEILLSVPFAWLKRKVKRYIGQEKTRKADLQIAQWLLYLFKV